MTEEHHLTKTTSGGKTTEEEQHSSSSYQLPSSADQSYQPPVVLEQPTVPAVSAPAALPAPKPAQPKHHPQQSPAKPQRTATQQPQTLPQVTTPVPQQIPQLVPQQMPQRWVSPTPGLAQQSKPVTMSQQPTIISAGQPHMPRYVSPSPQQTGMERRQAVRHASPFSQSQSFTEMRTQRSEQMYSTQSLGSAPQLPPVQIDITIPPQLKRPSQYGQSTIKARGKRLPSHAYQTAVTRTCITNTDLFDNRLDRHTRQSCLLQ